MDSILLIFHLLEDFRVAIPSIYNFPFLLLWTLRWFFVSNFSFSRYRMNITRSLKKPNLGMGPEALIRNLNRNRNELTCDFQPVQSNLHQTRANNRMNQNGRGRRARNFEQAIAGKNSGYSSEEVLECRCYLSNQERYEINIEIFSTMLRRTR